MQTPSHSGEWSGPTARLYGEWVAACAAAEFLGIALGALWWIAMDRIDPDPVTLAGKLVMLALKSLSGLAEGLVLGSLQARVLRRIYPRVTFSAWIALTASLAIFGWAAGSAIPIFGAAGGGGVSEPPLALLSLFAAAFGLVVGALFGGVQGIALRQAARDSYWWILFNAAGWALALPVIYLAASLPGPSSGAWFVAATALVSGAIAGIVIGAVTGLAFRRMEPK